MSYNKLFINNFLINLEGSNDTIPLNLLTRFFGIQQEWLDSNRLVLKRNPISYYLTIDQDDSLPICILKDDFSFSVQSDTLETINIIDPLTLPFYQHFSKKHPIASIQALHVDNSETAYTPKCYIVYKKKDSKNLALSVISKDGKWLYDENIPGTEILSLVTKKTADNYQLFIQTQDNAPLFVNYLSVFNITEDLSPIKVFHSKGDIFLDQNSISIYSPINAQEKLWLEESYKWGQDNSYETFRVFLKDSENDIVINLQDAREVSMAFRKALFTGNEALARYLCSDDIDEFSLNNLIEFHNLKVQNMQKESLYCTIWHDGTAKMVILTYLASFDIKYFRSPHAIIRLVLYQENKLWKISKLANLGDSLPASVINHDVIDIKIKEDSLYTNFPQHYTSFSENSWIRIFCKYMHKTVTRFDIYCDYIEITELLPGLEISFQDKKKGMEVGLYQSQYANQVKIEKISNYCYNVHILLEL